MREIKFRGKRIDNGEWVYGNFVLYEHMGRVKPIIITDCGQFYQNSHFVIPETAGQYAGLKDRNGTEIYEGDILRNVDNPFVDELPFEVVWSKHLGAWFWWELEGGAGTDHLYQSIAEDCEVIGNIHDWREE